MNNFDLTKYLAEGKLNEALAPQDVVDIADTVAEEFTKESADEGDFLIYTVGRMEGESFELDTETTAQTPDSVDPIGVGEGWGGNFSIRSKGEGYEVRNGEKGGLVAIIDNMGNFRMLSAAESRAEMDRAKGEETDYMERRRETDDYMQETLVDADQDMAEAILNALGGEAAFEAVVRAMSTDDAQIYLGGIIRDYDLFEEEIKEIKSNKMKKSELKEMIKAAMSENARTDAEEEGYLDGMRDEKEDMKEAEDVEVEDNENIDVDIEKDIEVDDKESEVDVDIKASMPGESEDVEEVQALLIKAQEAAESLGDDKLQDQIGNTITYFTRAHVAGNVSEMDDMDVNVNTTEMEAEMGLEEIQNSPELEKAKEDYMAGKISLADYQAIVKKLDFKGVKDAEAAGQAKKDAIAAKNKDLADKKAAVKQAEKDRKAGKISQEEFAKIVQANQYINKENLNESVMFPMWNKIK